MDADILRLILFLAGVALILGIYLWDRHQKNSRRVHAIRRALQEEQEQTRQEPAWGTAEDAAAPAEPALEGADLEQALEQLDQLVQEERPQQAPPLGEQTAFSFDEEPGNDAADAALPTMILQLNVRVRKGMAGGDAIMDVAREISMEPGEMQIFHRYEADGPGRVPSFSMANLVEPGVFPLQRMSEFSTPGVTLFTQLPGVKNGMEIFDDMLAAAERIAAMLDGEIQDETHSDLSHQTIEHIREKIAEHSRQLRLARQRP